MSRQIALNMVLGTAQQCSRPWDSDIPTQNDSKWFWVDSDLLAWLKTATDEMCGLPWPDPTLPHLGAKKRFTLMLHREHILVQLFLCLFPRPSAALPTPCYRDRTTLTGIPSTLPPSLKYFTWGSPPFSSYLVPYRAVSGPNKSTAFCNVRLSP